jgi:hypothetical protein
METNRGEDFTTFEHEKPKDRIVEEALTLQDIVNLNTMSIKISFVDLERIPFCYEVVLATIKVMEDRIGLPDFNMATLTNIYDLADTLFDTYNARLKLYYFDMMKEQSKTIDNINFVGSKTITSYHDLNISRVKRVDNTSNALPVETTNKYVMPTKQTEEKKWV